MNADEFNDRFPVGQEVRYFPLEDNENYVMTRTTCLAWQDGWGKDWIQIEGSAPPVPLRLVGPRDTTSWETIPPGGEFAIGLGCTCPPEDNCFGKGFGGGILDDEGKLQFVIKGNCPIHGPFHGVKLKRPWEG